MEPAGDLGAHQRAGARGTGGRGKARLARGHDKHARAESQKDKCISCVNYSTYCEIGIDVRQYAMANLDVKRAPCVGCGMCQVCPRGMLKFEVKRAAAACSRALHGAARRLAALPLEPGLQRRRSGRVGMLQRGPAVTGLIGADVFL